MFHNIFKEFVIHGSLGCIIDQKCDLNMFIAYSVFFLYLTLNVQQDAGMKKCLLLILKIEIKSLVFTIFSPINSKGDILQKQHSYALVYT